MELTDEGIKLLQLKAATELAQTEYALDMVDNLFKDWFYEQSKREIVALFVNCAIGRFVEAPESESELGDTIDGKIELGKVNPKWKTRKETM